MKKKIEKLQDKNSMSLEEIGKILGHNDRKNTIERYRKKYLETI